MTTDCRHNTQLTQVAHTHIHRDRQATTPLKFHSPRPPFLASSSALATAAQAGKQKELKVQTKLLCMFQCYNVSCPPSPLLLLLLLAVCCSCNSRRSCHSSELRLKLLLWLCLHTGRAGPGWPRLEWEWE